MLHLILALTLAQQIDKASRNAFIDLRNFQVAELEEFKNQKPWPGNLHNDIDAKIAIAYECIQDSIRYDLTVEQVQSLLRNEMQNVASLNGLVSPIAPKKLRNLMNKLQDSFAKLYLLYPIKVDIDHPPKD